MSPPAAAPAEDMGRCEASGQRLALHLTVGLPGHESSISPAVQGMTEVVKAARCATGKEFEVETALREALANAVVHGCANDPSKIVECALWCGQSGELTIVVRDPGPGFDPSSVPSPLVGTNVYSTHGRGIYMIRHLMDEVWFERGGSEIHMVLNGASRGGPGT